ncbi:DUF998 domain-containing protein [Saccharomonospora sp. NPDC046836]|uniref:DUF998 domain-containing protein n=1 Tax=Saccharomonospora sp. NPDC046836 TaxID=3156921 RepID=UPI0033DEBA8C
MNNLGTHTGATAVTRTRTWSITAWASLGWALFTLLILHAVSSFNPLVDPLSRYAFSDHGGGMLAGSLLSFAVGVFAVRGALLASGITFGRTTSVVVYATALGLVLAALFPASFTPEIDPVSGRIHQYASLIAFLCLPAIPFSLLDRLRDVAGLADAYAKLVRLLQISLGSLVLFGFSYVAQALPQTAVVLTASTLLPVGFTQRIVFVAYFCLLAALLLVAIRHARLRGTSHVN